MTAMDFPWLQQHQGGRYVARTGKEVIAYIEPADEVHVY